MASLFDHIFRSMARPVLQQHFDTDESLSIWAGNGEILFDQGACAIHPLEDQEQINDSGLTVQVETVMVTITLKEFCCRTGLENRLAGAKAELNRHGEVQAWAVDQVVSWTATAVRLLLVRRSPRHVARSGFYRDDYR